MTYIKRTLDINLLARNRSLFIIGPRQTGKTLLIEKSLPPDVPTYSLLDSSIFLELSQDPTLIRQKLSAQNHTEGFVVIDEIQKLPALLDEVHLMIEKTKIRFILTGSSARKLKTVGTNLLGGRARTYHLHPLSFHELGDEFDLIKALNRGLLPSIYFSEEPRLDLRSYVGSYLAQEIALEASVRNIQSFTRFLTIAAECNGQIINYTNIGNDSKVERRIVTEYFEILKDTLIAHEVPAWNKSKKRKAVETSKFYFFDGGVARAITNKPPVRERSADFGEAFEQFIFHELQTWIDYRSPETFLHYWRTSTGFEVDFLLGMSVAIEVKGMANVPERELKGIRALKEEKKFKRYVVVSLETVRRKTDDDIEILPYGEFLKSLWNDEYKETLEDI